MVFSGSMSQKRPVWDCAIGLPINWGGARGVNVAIYYGSPMSRVWVGRTGPDPSKLLHLDG